jgi:hypothetical protein
MSANEPMSLDPRALAVLQEVAGQEDSLLLRQPRTRGTGSRDFLAKTPVSAGAAFLSAAERQLLTVHREEVASWMRRAAFQLLFEQDGRSGLMARELDARRSIQLPGRQALQEEALLCLAPAGANGMDPEAVSRVERTARVGLANDADPWDLAAISLRLEEHPVPRQWYAFHLLELGHVQSTQRLLAEAGEIALRPAKSATQRAFLELLGATAAAQGDWGAASDAYVQAAQSPTGGRLTAIWAVLNGLQAGQQDRVRTAIERCADLGIHGMEVDVAVRRALEVARRVHGWKPTGQALQTVRVLDGSLGEALRTWMR